MLECNKDNIVPFQCAANIQFEKGMKAYKIGNLRQAIVYIQEACTIDNRNDRYHVQLAMFLTEGRQWEAALTLLNKMDIQGDQEDVCQLLLTICYTHIGENELAKFYADEFVHTVTEKDKESSFHFNEISRNEKIHVLLYLAMRFMEQNTFEGLSKAILLLEKAANINGSSVYINNLLAQSYICIKDYHAAKRCLHKILEKDSDNIQAICNLMYLYHMTERYEELQVLLKRIENIVPFKEIDRLKFGCTLARLGKFTQAFECLKNIWDPEYCMRKSYTYWMFQCSNHLRVEHMKDTYKWKSYKLK